MELWEKVHHLFDTDDGSLPDIFIENITENESIKIYSWVLSLTQPQKDANVWSIKDNKVILITDLVNPAQEYVQGNIESFRHCLEEFIFYGINIPQLSISIGETGIDLDYRMGKEWGEKEVIALFEFLFQIIVIAPNAKIVQAYEGGYYSPNLDFTKAFDEFINEKS